MPIPSTIESLSATIGSNVPAEGDGTLMTAVNDGFRAAYGFIRQIVSSGSDIASASTITPASTASSFTVTGTTTITAIGSTYSWDGRMIALRFAGALTLTHSSNLVLPASSNITTAADDYAIMRQHSSGVWHCVSYLRASGIPLVSGSDSTKFIRGDGTASGTLGGSLTVNAAVGAKVEVQDSGDSNRGGYLTTTASAFLVSSNSAVRSTIIGQDGNSVITVDTGRNVTIAAPASGNTLTINANTNVDTYTRYTNASSTAATGYRVTNTSGVDAQLTANANSNVIFGSISNHPISVVINSVGVGGWTTSAAFLINATSAVGSEKLLVKQTTGATDSAQTIWNDATSGNNQFVSFGTEGTFTTRGSISYNRAGGLVAYNTTSDYRAKDELGVVNNTGDVIDAMKVKMARIKGATIARPMFIAHELKEVAPYCVTGEKDEIDGGGRPIYQQVDHQSLVPLLVAELQDIRRRLAVLEAGSVGRGDTPRTPPI